MNLKARISDRLYEQIIKIYLDTASVKDTAARLQVSVVKVRRVLITEGLWASRTSLAIEGYLRQGRSAREIAESLSITEKAVQQYLPYTRGLYMGANRSSSALNSEAYRSRIRFLQEKILKRNEGFFMEDKWRKKRRYTRRGETENRMEAIGIYPGIEPLRLHLELVRRNEHSKRETEEISRVLRAYGQVKYGETISRDVFVPEDMPLWALHYMLQRCFGWQNSHLHQFELPKERFLKITDGNMGKYAELVGVIFRCPWMADEEVFWNDDYERGSFRTWIRKKYTGPYRSLCHGEGIWQCKIDMEEMREHYAYVEIKHYVSHNWDHFGWPEPISKEEYEKKRRLPPKREQEESFGSRSNFFREVYAFEDIPLQVADYMAERPCTPLLERLTVGEVLLAHKKGLRGPLSKWQKLPDRFAEVMDEELKVEIEECLEEDDPVMQPLIEPITDTLYYNYDFGDNWDVRITASYGAEDLVEAGRISQEELEQATTAMMETYRPVCIAQDGCFVMDDAGGMDGFIQFLKGINQPRSKHIDIGQSEEDYGPYEDREESLEWAKGQGWSRRKVRNAKLL